MSAGSVRAMRTITIALVGLVTAGVGLLGATAAQAHNVLRSTDPADGSTVATAPEQVTLTFDEPALALGTEIEVRSPDGTLVSDGDPVLVDSTVTEKLAGELPAGEYAVTWRVTSVDGHPITGEFSFTASAGTTIGDAPTSTPSSSAADEGSADEGSAGRSGGGGGAPVIVAVVVAAVVMSWLLWRRRRPRDVSGDA